MRITGNFVDCSAMSEPYTAFIPVPLPPSPPLEFSPALLELMERANRALGRLDGIADLLPDKRLFIYQYVRKEALVSSQIEGTQSSLSDLLRYEIDEAPNVPMDDVAEVSSYIRALDHGLQQLESGLPLSLRLLKDVHAILLSNGRGASKQPGEFRTIQNWIGGHKPSAASFVPPPPEKLLECLGELEQFLHANNSGLPILVRTALAHVQFETIHPFLDGNGRLGRLLIVLMLVDADVLQQPMLYLSLFFKNRRQEYYDRLSAVRQHGDWEGWLKFFLLGVTETSDLAVETARNLLTLFADDLQKIQSLGRLSGSAVQVHQHLQQQPIATIAGIVQATGVNRTSVSKVLEQLQKHQIVDELTGQGRNRLFVYKEYLALLADGTEPLNR